MAYQGYGRGLPIRELELVDRFSTGRLSPDLTILFDLPVEVGLRKAISSKKEFSAGGDRIERAGLPFHRKVRLGYLDLARRHRRIRVVPVLSGSTPDSTFAQVRSILNLAISKSSRHGPRRTKR